MKRGFLCWLMLTCTYAAFSQADIGLDIHSGFGMHTGSEFYQGNEAKSRNTVTQAGLRFEFGLAKRIELETGLSAKYIYAAGEIGNSTFRYHTLRAVLPLGIKYNLTEKWNGSLGVHMQNNRDFDDILTQQAFNFRFDNYLQLAYQASGRVAFSLRYQFALSKMNSVYFINDAQQAIMFGLTCYLNTHRAE